MNKERVIPQGYKDSPLGIIPKEWEVKRLGDYVTITSGESPSLYELRETGLYPYVKVEDLNNCSKYQIESREYSNDTRNIIPKGSIIFPKRGAAILNNKVRIAQTDILMDSNMMAITVKDSCLDYEFLYYTIIREQLYKIADTSTIPQINNKHIIPYRFCLPLMDEQKNIVSLLITWDVAIEKQSKLIEKLTLRKRALMQQLLTGKKRLPGFSEDWKEVKLGEFGTFFKGGGVPKDKIIGEGHKCLTYGDLYTKYDFVISDVQSYIDDETANESTEIQYGDICFAGSGETKEEIGKCATFIDGEYGYAGGDIIVYRAKGVNPITLSYILNSDNVIRQKSNMGQGHSVVHIYPYQLEKISIKLPPKEEQDAIASILMKADKEIGLANEELTNLESQKRGLMQQLLTGKKRVIG
ncbi:MAG: restriction endonuclease subunit S [Bacteroidaceae bacterium]|nr:restriction endonuclease subunit S [Bacteroidaceae bacterium]